MSRPKKQNGASAMTFVCEGISNVQLRAQREWLCQDLTFAFLSHPEASS